MFSTKIKSFIYRNHSYLYSPFNVGVNVFRYHQIYEYVTPQLIPTTIYSQGQPCIHKRCGAKPPLGAGLGGLSLCLLLPTPRGPDEGPALAVSLCTRAGVGGQRRGRALGGRDGQSRPRPARMPRVGPTPVRGVPENQAAGGRGSQKAGPIRGVKTVPLLTRKKGPTEL